MSSRCHIAGWSTRYVLSSRSSFSTTPQPVGHSMDISKAIEHHPNAIVRLWHLILILQVGLNITALSIFWALGAHLAQPLGPWGTVLILRKLGNTTPMPSLGR